jgi:Holliday junction resolvase RusA-like endonuclease
MTTMTPRELKALGYAHDGNGTLTRVPQGGRLSRRARRTPRVTDWADVIARMQATRDGDSLTVMLPIPPRTNKNSKTHVARENPAYRKFRKQVVSLIALHRGRLQLPLPVTFYNCEAAFFCDGDNADLHGLMQGLADACERASILLDDWYIRSWDGSNVFVDRENPRVAFRLTPREWPVASPPWCAP